MISTRLMAASNALHARAYDAAHAAAMVVNVYGYDHPDARAGRDRAQRLRRAGAVLYAIARLIDLRIP